MIKKLQGNRKSLIRELLDDPDFEKAVMEKFNEHKTEKELVKTFRETTGY